MLGGGPWKGRGGSEPPEEDREPQPACEPHLRASMLSVCRTGYTICYHPQAVFQVVNEGDVKLLFSSEQAPACPTHGTGPPVSPIGWAPKCEGLGVGVIGDRSPPGLEGGGGGARAHPAPPPHPREHGALSSTWAGVGVASDWSLPLGAFKDLQKDPEPGIQEFATRQLSFLPRVAASRK